VQGSTLLLEENKITLVILSEYTKGGIQYNFGLRPTNLDYGCCKIRLINSTGVTGLRLVDANRNVKKFFFFYFNLCVGKIYLKQNFKDLKSSLQNPILSSISFQPSFFAYHSSQ
jgi:hypothetical protein